MARPFCREVVFRVYKLSICEVPMATGFDFEDFFVNDTVKTEAVIDRSGVNLQDPTETAESATNNVVYYVSSIVATLADGSSVVISGQDLRIVIEGFNGGSSQATRNYLSVWHALGEVAGLGIAPDWNPGTERLYSFNAVPTDGFRYRLIDDNTGNSTTVSSFVAAVYPRYEMETGVFPTLRGTQMAAGIPAMPVNQGPVDYPGVMKLLYGVLGIYGDRWKGLRWLGKVWDDGECGESSADDVAVLSYDRFRRRMNYLADTCLDAGVGFTVNYYDDSYAEEVTATDATPEDYRANPAAAAIQHSAYLAAVAAADVTRTDMGSDTTFAEAYGPGGKLDKFIAKTGYIGYSGVPTAVIPPVADVAKAFFYPADELEEDFSRLFKSVMDALSRVPGVWRFVSKNTKNRLDAVKERYVEEPRRGYGRLAFDLECALASLLDPGNTEKFPRLVQIGGGDSGSLVACVYLSRISWGVARESGGDYANGYEGADDTERNRVNKMYSRLKCDEVGRRLATYYNSAVSAGMRGDSARPVDVERFVGLLPPDGNGQVDLMAEYPDFAQWMGEVSAFLNYCRAMGGDSGEQGVADDDAGGIHSWTTSPTPMSSIVAWVNAGGSNVLSGYYDVIDWEEAVSSDATEYSGGDLFVPSYPDTWKDIASNPDESAGLALRAVEVMEDAYGQMRNAAIAETLVLGAALASRAILALSAVSDDLDELSTVVKRLTWYQRVTGESPFTNRSMIPPDGEVDTMLYAMPAHLAFPVMMYKKVRVKYRNFLGRTRHRTVKKPIGVRWAEVTFYDTTVYGEYPTVETEPTEQLQLSGTCDISSGDDGTAYVEMSDPLPARAVEAGEGSLYFVGNSAGVAVKVLGDTLLEVTGALPVSTGTPDCIRVPLERSKPDGSREPVTVKYSMPGLPYDSEIRKKAFIDFGSLSQSSTFEAVRNTGIDPDRQEGWRVFRDTSSSIADLRDGLGIHDKVAMLVSVLKHEFGDRRVSLVDTYRSADDQAKMCSGGPESAFLSWHNYGLAARVLLLKEDGVTPMEKDDPDMKRLVKVARAFTECCEQGKIGAPCNVVWCARLAVGPSIFDWEFLPVGVGHKDAPRFRDAAMAQRDPVADLGFVDVDAAGYVRRTPPGDGTPYILSSSPALKSAEVRGGHRYVSPDRIRDLSRPSDIVLYDVREFVDLVRLKMGANGTALPASGSIYDWKAMNPDSFEQLVRYYAMVDSVASAKALLAGDFVERYLPVEEQFFNTSPVDYVKGMLGSHYGTARVCTARDGDSSYITLHDGILHIRQTDAYPDNPPTRFDMHKQQQVDAAHVRRGTWQDGVFYDEDDPLHPAPYIDSEFPVIDGYEDGEAVGGEAVLLHQVVATRIHKAFEEIRKSFEGFGGSLMYDRVADGPNAGMADMLENEFGLIGAQDLIDFDTLEALVNAMVDGTLDAGPGRSERDRTLVDGSIYEKVVNNAQLAGVRKASLDREHIHVKDMPTPDDGKTLYALLSKGRGYTANDLI